MELKTTHPAVIAGHSIANAKFRDKPTDQPVKSQKGLRVLKAGTNGKIGKVVTVKRWNGSPIYALTLEERATCPRTCEHWANCFGNNMPFGQRYSTTGLEDAISADLDLLDKRHPRGYVLRLHILGDFYSVGYVQFWGEMMAAHPLLRIFGYSARMAEGGLVGAALESLKALQTERFRVRGSGMGEVLDAANSEDTYDGTGFYCPHQLGKTQDCGTCGACWATRKPVIFKTH